MLILLLIQPRKRPEQYGHAIVLQESDAKEQNTSGNRTFIIIPQESLGVAQRDILDALCQVCNITAFV